MDQDGWKPDPFRSHEERLFKDGEPTPLVRDGGVGSYDAPPAAFYATGQAGSTAEPHPNHPTQRPIETATSLSAGQAEVTVESQAVSGTVSVPAGWYPDSHAGGQLRYWNGDGWTEHFGSPSPPFTSVTPSSLPAELPAVIAPSPPPEMASTNVPLFKRWWFWATITLLVIIAAAAFVVTNKKSNSRPDSGSTATPTSTVQTSPSTTSEQEAVGAWASANSATMTTLTDDVTQIGADASKPVVGNPLGLTPVEADCKKMTGDVNAAETLPSIPDTTAESDWQQTLSDYGQAASDLYTGLTSFSQTEVSVATNEFIQANSELGITQAAIQAAEQQ